MSYALQGSTSTQVNIPRITIGANEDFTLAIDFYTGNLAAASVQALMGRTGTFNHFLWKDTSNKLVTRLAGINNVSTFTFLSYTRYMLILNKEGDNLTITANGELIVNAVYATTYAIEFDQINAAGNSLYRSQFTYYSISLTTSTPQRFYNPSQSYGLGIVLIDTAFGQDGTIVNPPADGSHWVWYEDTTPNTGESRVGLGWAPSIRDYSSLEAWRDGISNTQKNTALCRGSLLTRHLSIGGSNVFPLGLEIVGAIKYNGNNHLQLAHSNNFGLDIGGSPTTVHHLRLYTDNQYYVPAWIRYETATQADVLSFNYCHIKHTNVEKKSSPISIQNASDNDGFFNCVIDCDGRALGYLTGYGTNVVLNGNIFINYTESGFRSISGGTTAGRHFTNNFCPENTGTDYNAPNAASFTNNASADTTGNVTGYGKEQFVDFANGDYRIKASSPLHALGIGAFFEDTGVTQPSTAYSFKVYSGGVFVPAIAKVRQSNAWTVATPRG